MQKNIPRLAALLLWIFSSGAFAEAPVVARQQVLVVINRPVTAEEKGSGRQIVLANLNQLMAHSHGADVIRETRLQLMKRVVAEMNPQQAPFTIEFSETGAGITLSDITFVSETARRTIPLADVLAALPENMRPRTPVEPVTTEQLETLVAQGKSGPELTAKILWWLTEARRNEVQCDGDSPNFATPVIRRLFEAAHLAPQPTVDLRPIFTATALDLRADQRLSIFDMQRTDAPCLRPIAKAWWEYLVAEQRAALVADFQPHLQYLGEHRGRFAFNGLIEAHTFTDPEGDLTSRLYFLQEILLRTPGVAFQGALPLAFRQWATTDTNTPDVASRLEPIDILSTFVSNHHFNPLKQGTTFNDVSRNALARQAIQHVVAPDVYPPTVLIVKSDAARTRADGHETHFIYCAGETITLGGNSPLRAAGTPLADSLAVPTDWLETLRRENRTDPFQCGAIGAALSNQVEPLHIPLVDPAGTRFSVGEDRKVKGVSTFQIVSAVGNDFIAKLKVGAIVKGYTTVEETKTTDIRAEFFRELLDADFYFPANHSTNGTEVAIGDDGAMKVRIQKKMGNGVTSEVVLFVPQGGVQQIVSDAEIAQLFKRRRALPVQRRLHIMDLKCGSFRSVPHWMRFYKLSLDEMVQETEARAKARELEGEVPVAIGAGRNFDPTNFAALLEHSNYPFRALDLAAAEQPVSDLIGFLRETAFAPNTSNGEPTYFDAKTQTDGVNLVVTLANGQRIK